MIWKKEDKYIVSDLDLSPQGWQETDTMPEKILTPQEQVLALEAQTGLTRAVRELALAENSGASDYVRKQAQEIESLAAPLREAEQ